MITQLRPVHSVGSPSVKPNGSLAKLLTSLRTQATKLHMRTEMGENRKFIDSLQNGLHRAREATAHRTSWPVGSALDLRLIVEKIDYSPHAPEDLQHAAAALRQAMQRADVEVARTAAAADLDGPRSPSAGMRMVLKEIAADSLSPAARRVASNALHKLGTAALAPAPASAATPAAFGSFMAVSANALATPHPAVGFGSRFVNASASTPTAPHPVGPFGSHFVAASASALAMQPTAALGNLCVDSRKRPSEGIFSALGGRRAPTDVIGAIKYRSQIISHEPIEGHSKTPDHLRAARLSGADGSELGLTNTQWAGSFGKVRVGLFLAGPRNGQLAAVKEMRRLPKLDPVAKKRYTLDTADEDVEAEKLAILHAHGPDFLMAHLASEKSNFLVMPLMEGDLCALIKTTRQADVPMNDADKVHLFFGAAKQLSEELYNFHTVTQSVVSDIKPPNILLHQTLGFKLADFGLVTPVNLHTGLINGASFGTPGYNAPEKYWPNSTGLNSDVWGMGVTLLEIVTAHRNPLNRFKSPKVANLSYLKQEVQLHKEYIDWHSAQTRTGYNKIDIENLSPAESPYTVYFNELRKLGTTLCETMLDSVLQPNPELRWSSEQLAQWAADQHAGLKVPDYAKNMLRWHADEHDSTENIVDQLQLHRDAILSQS
jgi:serine/threonine protein kinase